VSLQVLRRWQQPLAPSFSFSWRSQTLHRQRSQLVHCFGVCLLASLLLLQRFNGHNQVAKKRPLTRHNFLDLVMMLRNFARILRTSTLRRYTTDNFYDVKLTPEAQEGCCRC
jgi:hypothetical protein